MNKHERKGRRLTALFIMGVMLFNYPVVALFSVEQTFLGIPTLFVYLFLAWGFFIGLTMLIVERK